MKIKAPDAFDDTPEGLLFAAVRKEDITGIRRLLKEGVPVDCRNSLGGTPLMMAGWSGKLNVVEELIAHDANIHLRDNGGSTPLMWASWNGHTDVMERLLALGAQVDAKSNRGCTALVWLAENGDDDEQSLRAMRVLLDHGASLEEEDEFGQNALAKAAEKWNSDSYHMLRAEPERRARKAAEEAAAAHAATVRALEVQRRTIVAARQAQLRGHHAARPKKLGPGA